MRIDRIPDVTPQKTNSERMPVFTSLFPFRAALEPSTVRYCFEDGVEEARMETPAARTSQRVCRDYRKSNAIERYSVLKLRSENLHG